MKSCLPALAADGIERSAGAGEEADSFVVTAGSCIHQRREAVDVARVRIAAALKQKADRLRVAVARGEHEGRAPLVVAALGIGSVLFNQAVDHLGVGGVGGEHESILPPVVAQGRIASGFEQPTRGLRVPGGQGMQEGRAPFSVARIEGKRVPVGGTPAGGAQHLSELGGAVFILRRAHEGGAALVVRARDGGWASRCLNQQTRAERAVVRGARALVFRVDAELQLFRRGLTEQVGLLGKDGLEAEAVQGGAPHVVVVLGVASAL